jgi:hypothetical protein
MFLQTIASSFVLNETGVDTEAEHLYEMMTDLELFLFCLGMCRFFEITDKLIKKAQVKNVDLAHLQEAVSAYKASIEGGWLRAWPPT